MRTGGDTKATGAELLLYVALRARPQTCRPGPASASALLRHRRTRMRLTHERQSTGGRLRKKKGRPIEAPRCIRLGSRIGIPLKPTLGLFYFTKHSDFGSDLIFDVGLAEPSHSIVNLTAGYNRDPAWYLCSGVLGKEKSYYRKLWIG